ncbi:MAG: ABC transporter substrate-binding protein [Egibacteraceae bacterium]
MSTTLLDPHPITDEVTRRGLLTGAAALGILTVLPARGWGQDAADAGPWEFTDDRGVTITLDQRPQRVVAFVSAAAALSDFGVRPIAIFGPSRREDGSRADHQVGNLDLGELTSVGNTYGEFNVEQYAALRPDLLVSLMYTPEPPLWYVPEESAAEIERVAPTVGIEISGTITTVDKTIGRFAELALALGADPEGPGFTGAKARFDAASQDLAAIARDKPGLKVMAASGYTEGLYVAKPGEANDLRYFAELGLDIVAPRGEGDFWEALSWEQTDRYPADVILHDARFQAFTLEHMAEEFPTWSQLPAVQAGQIIPWRFEAPYSYASFASVIEEINAALKSFDEGLVG